MREARQGFLPGTDAMSDRSPAAIEGTPPAILAPGVTMADVERREQMFPRLAPAQLARLTKVGRRRPVAAGEIIFDQGESTPSFFVILFGTMEIAQPADGRELPVTVHRAGEFTGEVNMLSGRRALVRARMAEAGELLVVTSEALRALVQNDP